MGDDQRARMSLLLGCSALAISLTSAAGLWWRRRRVLNDAALAPDVEYLLARAQTLQLQSGAAFLTAEHLSGAMDGAGPMGPGPKDPGLTKGELEDTMKSMLGIQPPGGLADGETALEKFTTDLTASARRGKLDPLVGRDAEMRRVVHILLRRTKNNPVLVGEPGVGKTAIAEGLAQRIVAGDVPVGLLGSQLLELDLASLAAGCVMPGEFEERLKAVVTEITDSPRRIVLFIDDIHNLVPSAANQGGSMVDGSAILKPALARGALRCVAASSIDKFKKTIERDPGLERRFQQVLVEPTSVPETTSILRGLRPRYEAYHGISISEGALLAASTLSQRYISGRHLPDKAIDCLDEAAAQVKMESSASPETLDALDRQIRSLQEEELQLARRAGETPASSFSLTSPSSSSGHFSRSSSEGLGAGGALGGVTAVMQRSGSGRGPAGPRDSVAAHALAEVRVKLRTLSEERARLGTAVAAEKEEAQERLKMKMEAARLRFEAESAQRRGMPEEEVAALESTAADMEEAYSSAEAVAQAGAAGGTRHTRVSRDEVSEQDVARVISKWTGIPISKLISSERERLLQLGAELHKRIIGQMDAVAAVATAIQRSRADLSDPNGPIASFMFLGPTGVGKTELAKALAAFLFNTEDAMVRLDMSEYMEKYSTSRLIGAPPGYVGYDEGGLLTDAVRRRPYSVVLLDEVEKAHADVFNILLQLLDDGRVTDSLGRTVSFKNCVIIMTSNLGSAEIFQHLPSGSKAALKTRVMEAVKAHFRPEFINRVDEFIVFEPLVREQIRDIVGLRAAALVERVARQRLGMELTDSAIDFLAAKGFDPVYGARPVKRALQRELQTLLAQALLRGEFIEGDVIQVAAAADGSCLTLTKGGTRATTPSRAAGAGVANGDVTEQESVAAGAAGQPAAAGGAAPGGKPSGRRVVVRGSRKGAAPGGSAGVPAVVEGLNGSSLNGHTDE